MRLKWLRLTTMLGALLAIALFNGETQALEVDNCTAVIVDGPGRCDDLHEEGWPGTNSCLARPDGCSGTPTVSCTDLLDYERDPITNEPIPHYWWICSWVET
jgi:hypothetical protein